MPQDYQEIAKELLIALIDKNGVQPRALTEKKTVDEVDRAKLVGEMFNAIYNEIKPKK